MSAFTSKQRKQIYLEAASSDKLSHGCCYTIIVITRTSYHAVPVNEQNYPELLLFKESNMLWWLNSSSESVREFLHTSSQEGQDLRRLVLLLCAEMCND